MILMLAPLGAANMSFGVAPSGATYTSNQQGIILVANNSTADQTALQALGCSTLTSLGPWGCLGFDTLADLYSYDVAGNAPRWTVATVFADTGTRDGTYHKTGTGTGSGNWTQADMLTLAGLQAQIVAETARAESAETALGAQIGTVPPMHFAGNGAVRVASVASTPSATYSNGSAGVGATLTATANGALTIDGVAVATADRVLLQDQSGASRNGVYVVTQPGSGSTPFILTRDTDANTPALLAGILVTVTAGTVNAGLVFLLPQSIAAITIGTTNLNFSQVLT